MCCKIRSDSSIGLRNRYSPPVAVYYVQGRDSKSEWALPHHLFLQYGAQPSRVLVFASGTSMIDSLSLSFVDLMFFCSVSEENDWLLMGSSSSMCGLPWLWCAELGWWGSWVGSCCAATERRNKRDGGRWAEGDPSPTPAFFCIAFYVHIWHYKVHRKKDR